MMRIHYSLIVAILSFAHTGIFAAELPPKHPDQEMVTRRDFFVYACMLEYMKNNSVPLFDDSYSFAVEYIRADVQQLETLHAAAKKLALSIPAPNYADSEHGSPAVLVICERGARKITKRSPKKAKS